MPSKSSTAAEAFRTTLDLFETGVALMRHNLRRANPDATEEVIEERLVAWLHERPGAEHGDCPGASSIWTPDPGDRPRVVRATDSSRPGA